MDRLTTSNGECSRLTENGSIEACCPDENCDEGCLNLRISRLADYEDTGLAPEQIREMKKFISGIRSYYKSTESWDELFEEDYNNFAEDINVPAKSATDSNVGGKKTDRKTVQTIVCCKDCKYRKDHHYEIEGEPPYIKHSCKFSKYSMPDYGFCSCGKNKEEEIS